MSGYDGYKFGVNHRGERIRIWVKGEEGPVKKKKTYQELEAEVARLRNWLRVVAFHAVKERMKNGACPWHDDNCTAVLQSWAEGALHGEALDLKLVEGLPDPKVDTP